MFKTLNVVDILLDTKSTEMFFEIYADGTKNWRRLDTLDVKTRKYVH